MYNSKEFELTIEEPQITYVEVYERTPSLIYTWFQTCFLSHFYSRFNDD